jgi:hypothetical protein
MLIPSRQKAGTQTIGRLRGVGTAMTLPAERALAIDNSYAIGSRCAVKCRRKGAS